MSKAKVDLKRTPLTFIDGIVASADRSEEQFRDVRIETDGDLASVFFDYGFLSNGRETNHGGKRGTCCAPNRAGRSPRSYGR